MMPNLIELARPQAQTRRALEMDHTASDLNIRTLIAAVREGAKLVDREDVVNAIAQLVGDISRVVRERLCRIAVLPAALVHQRLRKIPVIERGEWLDVGSFHFVDEAAV